MSQSKQVDPPENRDRAVELLQQLGLKKNEAHCFVGLTRLYTGTAKRLAERTGVPQTQVYEAMRVLEARGLVEVQHSSPKRFRAVSVEEALEKLRDRYRARFDRLEETLSAVDRREAAEDAPHSE